MDKEVLRDVWNGKLPLCFKLHPDDVCGLHRPEPYHLMVPRVTYFPLVLDRVIKYFLRFIDQGKQVCDDMWLDYNGQAIKWHHPIGLSWDLIGPNYELPWRLILHFSDFPSKELVRCNSRASIESNFMSTIKEADTLKHKGSVIRNLVKKDHNQLWSSLVNDKFDQFWVINKRLMERTDNELFKNIPFRLYLPDCTYVQKLIKPCTNEPHIFLNTEKYQSASSNAMSIVKEYDSDISKAHKCSHTSNSGGGSGGEGPDQNPEHRCSILLDLIQVSFMDRMDELLLCKGGASKRVQQQQQQQNQQQVTQSSCKDDTDESSAQESISQSATCELIDVKLFRYRFISHGIDLPLDAPLQWLSEHLSYPDNFLHICAVAKDQLDYL